MAKEIWRLNAYWLGIEAASWTEATTKVRIPVNDANLSPKVTNMKDDSWIGVIDEYSDSDTTQEWSEFTATWIARSQTLWYMILMTLWTAWAPSLVETWVYSHTFTRLNNNNHPSASIVRDNTTQEEVALYHMMNTFAMNFVVGDYVRFDMASLWKKIADDTGNTPTYLTWTDDEQFKVSKAEIKFATNLAWLWAASAVCLQSFNMSIEKNVLPIYCTNSTEPDTLHNQQFGITWDFEAIYDSDVYKDLFTNQTNQAVQIEVTWETLIGSTEYNKLTIQLANVNLDEWDRSTDNNAIMNQTAWFTAKYSISDTQSINVVLQNVKTTQYAWT
jgi:hypothetical protein